MLAGEAHRLQLGIWARVCARGTVLRAAKRHEGLLQLRGGPGVGVPFWRREPSEAEVMVVLRI